MSIDYNVLHIIPFYSDLFGGPTMMVKELSNHFHQKGLSIDVISTNVNTSKHEFPLNTWIEDSLHGRVQIFNSPTRYTYYTSPSMARWLWKHLKDYDLVHCHCPFSFPVIWGSFLSSLFGVPFIISPHGNFNPWAVDYKGLKKQRFLTFGGRRLYSKASCIHILSETARTSIQELGISAPMRLIPNGIEAAPASDADTPVSLFHEHFQSEGKFTFSFLGRLDPQKGLERLIEAFGLLYEKHPNELQLILAGPDLINYRENIAHYLKTFNCEDGVVLPGMVREKVKTALLQHSDVFCFTSHSEGNSIALLEAMSFGKPCIVSEECNMEVAHQHDAVIQIDGENFISRYADAMLELFRNREKGKTLGARAKNFVRDHHSWSITTDRFLRLYEDIINKQAIE